MNGPADFLGGIAADVVVHRIGEGHPGIFVQEVTSFTYASFLQHLKAKALPRVAFAGLASSEVQTLCRKARYPDGLVTGDLAVATAWRNDPGVAESVVVVAFGEEERLGSFHRFAAVRDRDLYVAICDRAETDLCPNAVLSLWWKVLRRPEVMRQLSVHRMALYFLALEAEKKRLPQVSREAFHLLGLLPSRTFFEHASAPQLLKNYRANRHLAARIEILSNADRDRLNRAVERATGSNRDEFQRTLGKILKYNRSSADNDRGELVSEEVQALFEAKKDTPRPKGRPVSTELAAAEAILDDDEDEVRNLGERLRKLIADFDENETSRANIELTNRNEQASIVIPPPIVRLLARAIGDEVFGGIFRLGATSPTDRILDDIDRAEFVPFSRTGERTCDAMLRRVVNSQWLEPEALQHWEKMIAARRVLAVDAVAIALSPLVAFGSSDALLAAGREYLSAYEDLLAVLKSRFESLAKNSPTGTRHMCAQFLVLDTILFETAGSVRALLSPLHPLHLWKFVRLADQMRSDRQTLTEDYRHTLAERAEKLPNFVTALFIPEGLVAEHALVLPESGQLATLPWYQQDDPHFSGTEGQDRIVRILRKFLVLYPHASARLRIALVDPPMPGDLLELIASQITSAELPVAGAHIAVYRTLERPLTMGSDDEQVEIIAELFADDGGRQFSLEVHTEKTTYADVLTELDQQPVHVFVAFDPSRSQVGQFSGRDTGFIHPLVLPKEFQYDPMEDQLVITPAATGDIFDLYYSIQNRLNNALTGSHFGVSTTLGPNFPRVREILKRCTWLVVGDKLMDTQPLKEGHVISYEPGARRDIVVISDSFTKFERAFGYYLRRVNLDPTDEAIRELVTSSADLVNEGLLGLIRADGE